MKLRLPLVLGTVLTLACGGVATPESPSVAPVSAPVTQAPATPSAPDAPATPVVSGDAAALHGESVGLGWVDQYQRPAIADVDGDGVEDLVALFMHADDPKAQIHVGVFSGQGLRKLWSHGPVGQREADGRNIGVSVARGKVVLQEPFGLIRVFEADSGTQLEEFQLDKVPSWAKMCAPVGEETEINIDQQILVDLDTLKSRPAPRRSGERCWGRSGEQRKYAGDSSEGADTHALKKDQRKVWVRETADHGVRFEPAQAGAPEPQLIGYDPGSGTERWRMTLASATDAEETWRDKEPDHLDIVGDRVVVVYVPEEGFFPPAHVVAIDADVGRVRFDTPIYAGSMWTKVTLTPTHAYVVGIKWPAPPVSAVDLRSGRLTWVFGGP